MIICSETKMHPELQQHIKNLVLVEPYQKISLSSLSFRIVSWHSSWTVNQILAGGMLTASKHMTIYMFWIIRPNNNYRFVHIEWSKLNRRTYRGKSTTGTYRPSAISARKKILKSSRQAWLQSKGATSDGKMFHCMGHRVTDRWL